MSWEIPPFTVREGEKKPPPTYLPPPSLFGRGDVAEALGSFQLKGTSPAKNPACLWFSWVIVITLG